MITLGVMVGKERMRPLDPMLNVTMQLDENGELCKIKPSTTPSEVNDDLMQGLVPLLYRYKVCAVAVFAAVRR